MASRLKRSTRGGQLTARAMDVLLPPIVLSRDSQTPLHHQLRTQIARAIGDDLAAGMRLPSTRVLARLLGTSRNTVLAAYDDLAADGLIRARRGSGAVVAARGERGPRALDPGCVMRQAQYPARTMTFVDQDGTPFYLTY